MVYFLAIRKRGTKSEALTLGVTNKPLNTINNSSIVNCRSYRDLGIQFDPSLHFYEYNDVCYISAYCFINRIFRFITNTIPAIRKAYVSYARPHLEYASTVWNPGLDFRTFKGLKIQLENVQQFFKRRLIERYGLPYKPYKDRLMYLNLDSLEIRRTIFYLVMVYKLFNGLNSMDASSIINIKKTNYNTRSHSMQISTNKCKLNVTKNLLNNLITKIWNGLDENILLANSLYTFKNDIKKL